MSFKGIIRILWCGSLGRAHYDPRIPIGLYLFSKSLCMAPIAPKSESLWGPNSKVSHPEQILGSSRKPDQPRGPGHKSSPLTQKQGSPPKLSGLLLGGFAQLLSPWTLSSLHQELPFSLCWKPQPNWRTGPPFHVFPVELYHTLLSLGSFGFWSLPHLHNISLWVLSSLWFLVLEAISTCVPAAVLSSRMKMTVMVTGITLRSGGTPHPGSATALFSHSRANTFANTFWYDWKQESEWKELPWVLVPYRTFFWNYSQTLIWIYHNLLNFSE